MAHVLKKDRVWVLAHPEKSISNYQLTIINSLIKRRLEGEPLAYILGEQEVGGLKFKVNKNVLIPRPETEDMVNLICHCEEAQQRRCGNPDANTIKHEIATLPRKASVARNDIIIDLGTGSGCLIISLVKKLNNKNIAFFATDISAKALTVAKQNAKLNGVAGKIKFLHGNLLDPAIKNSVIKNCLKIKNFKLKIVCNLPYLKTGLKNLTKQQKLDLSFEPKIALMSGRDGLNHYRLLAKQLKKLVKLYPDLNLEIFCEADPDQMAGLKKIFADFQTEIKKDFRNKNRFLMAKNKK